MWSSPKVWDDGKFRSSLTSSGIKTIKTADYSTFSSLTFDPSNPQSVYGRNGVWEAITQALNEYKQNNIAASQVDIVAHSLGGLMTRSFSQKEYFKNAANYYQGYIHKLIMIGTPHRGSPLGPELWRIKDKWITTYIPIFPYSAPVKLSLLLKLAGMPIGTVHKDFGIESAGLKALAQTLPFKTFAITASYKGKGNDVEQTSDYRTLNTLTNLVFGKSVDAVFGSRCNDGPVLPSDLIVPVSSQKGYIEKDTVFYGTSHATIFPGDKTETNNVNIHKKVAELLLTNNTALFDEGFPAPSGQPLDCNTSTSRTDLRPVSSEQVLYAANEQKIEGGGNKYVQITSPVRGSAFMKNTNVAIPLTFEVKNDVLPTDGLFMVEGVGSFTVEDFSTGTVHFSLPETVPLGNVNIVLLVMDTTGNILSDTSHIVVTENRALTRISAEPDFVELDSAFREAAVYVHGYFKNGTDVIDEDITKASAGTLYTSLKGEKVFTVSKDGFLTAVNAGTDTLVVSNQGVTVKIPVIVKQDFTSNNKYENRIDFPNIAAKTIGEMPVGLNATASCGEDVSFSIVSGPAHVENGVLYGTAPGKVIVKASQNGNVYFAPAPDVLNEFCILPAQPLVIIGDTLSCAGKKVYSITKAAGTSYKWNLSGGGTIISEDTSATVNWTTPGKYVLKVTPIADACNGTAKEINITVRSVEKPSISQKENKLISSSATGNQWFLNDSAISGATDSLYSPLTNGNYSVQVTKNGCSSERSDTYSYMVTSINDPVLESRIVLFPNPIHQTLYIKSAVTEPVEVRLFDQLGKMILVRKIKFGTSEIDVTYLSKGVYLLLITGERTKTRITKKLLKL